MSRRKQKSSKRAPIRSAQPTFRDALQDMRLAAHQGVQDAISRAHLLSPPPNAKGRPRLAAGHTGQALFDGICEALAEAIVQTAATGSELALLHLVEDLLESKVQKQLCQGRC